MFVDRTDEYTTNNPVPVINEQALGVFLDAAKIIGKSLEPQDSIGGILKLLSDRLNLEKGRVVLPDEQTGELRIQYSFGLTADENSRGHYAIGEGITGQVMSTGKIALVPNIMSEPTYLARVSDITNFNTEPLAYIAVPILQEDEPVGVLAVHPSSKGLAEFNTDLVILQIFASMIGQVLHIHNLVQERTQQLVLENIKLKKAMSFDSTSYGIIGKSPVLHGAMKKALRAAESPATVMLIGESGSGKEKFARMIHLASSRRDHPFVCINCAAIPEHLLESELFGHEKGSFTGATNNRTGKFELASHGTLFLDEIGDMNLDLQTKLLRVLQERVIQRVGGNTEIPIDVRIISATNRNLDDAVNDGLFRLDLYYRLNVIRIHIPSLRERKEDIRLLALYFLNRLNQRYERNIALTASALELLESYDWPGNIRQLENVVERAVIMSEQEVISETDITGILQEESKIAVQNEPAAKSFVNPSPVSEQLIYNNTRPYARVRGDEKQKIVDALQNARGNKTQAAKHLGLTPRQLHYRLSKLGIS